MTFCIFSYTEILHKPAGLWNKCCCLLSCPQSSWLTPLSQWPSRKQLREPVQAKVQPISGGFLLQSWAEAGGKSRVFLLMHMLMSVHMKCKGNNTLRDLNHRQHFAGPAWKQVGPGVLYWQAFAHFLTHPRSIKNVIVDSILQYRGVLGLRFLPPSPLLFFCNSVMLVQHHFQIRKSISFPQLFQLQHFSMYHQFLSYSSSELIFWLWLCTSYKSWLQNSLVGGFPNWLLVKWLL